MPVTEVRQDKLKPKAATLDAARSDTRDTTAQGYPTSNDTSRRSSPDDDETDENGDLGLDPSIGFMALEDVVALEVPKIAAEMAKERAEERSLKKASRVGARNKGTVSEDDVVGRDTYLSADPGPFIWEESRPREATRAKSVSKDPHRSHLPTPPPVNQTDEVGTVVDARGRSNTLDTWSEASFEESINPPANQANEGEPANGDAVHDHEASPAGDSELNFYTLLTNGRLRCDYGGCGREFALENSWAQHVRWTHARKEASEVLLEPKLRANAFALKRFPIAEQDSTRTTCTKCGLRLSRTDALKRHLKICGDGKKKATRRSTVSTSAGGEDTASISTGVEDE